MAPIDCHLCNGVSLYFSYSKLLTVCLRMRRVLAVCVCAALSWKRIAYMIAGRLGFYLSSVREEPRYNMPLSRIFWDPFTSRGRIWSWCLNGLTRPQWCRELSVEMCTPNRCRWTVVIDYSTIVKRNSVECGIDFFSVGDSQKESS